MDAIENFKKSVNYWFVLVIWPAFKESLSLSDVGGKAVELTASLLLGSIGYYIFGSLNQIQGIGANILTILGMLVSSVIVRFGIAFLYQPVEIFWKEKRLADKYTWNDVVKKPNKDLPDTLCLMMDNQKDFEVRNCCGVMIRLEKSGNEIMKDDESGAKRVLAWEHQSGDFFGCLQLERKGRTGHNRRLIIARSNRSDEKAWIQFDKAVSNAYELDPGVRYRIRIRWHGEINEAQRLDEFTQDYWLNYANGEFDLKEAV